LTAEIEPISRNSLKFYDDAWAARLQLFRQWIGEGADNPYGIIRKLESRERRNELLVSDEGVTWRPHDFSGMGELLPNGVPALKGMTFRGEGAPVPQYMDARNYNYIVDLLAVETFDCVVELGCGFGRNLFEIFLGTGNGNLPYLGGEIADSGLAALEVLAELEPAADIRGFKFDFLDPDFSILEPYDKILIFSVHAIEQVHRLPSDLIEKMAGLGGRVVGVHFEPVGFQFQPDLGSMTQEHQSHAVSRKWNVNFAETLISAYRSGAIKEPFVVPEICGNDDLLNPTSLAVWESAPR
jgi:hypothetical protein